MIKDANLLKGIQKRRAYLINRSNLFQSLFQAPGCASQQIEESCEEGDVNNHKPLNASSALSV